MAKKSVEKTAIETLQLALASVVRIAGEALSPNAARTLRNGLAEHLVAIEAARSIADPILVPRTTFDPGDPKIVGRMVALGLLAQPRLPLASVAPSYGSGVYAIYYEGDHPFYAEISKTETPIYVGKADPSSQDASTSREQGPRLTARLLEHANTIQTAEAYAKTHQIQGTYPIRVDDFTCRRLVCATNAQLVAENHLIGMFWPLWNSETKACWGMSKHGDAAKTRANKKSPWDVVHPGRKWALDESLVDSLSLDQVRGRIIEVVERVPPRINHAELLEEILATFRQQDPIDVVAPPPLGASLTGPSNEEVGAE